MQYIIKSVSTKQLNYYLKMELILNLVFHSLHLPE
ncbi:hypothetical protein BZARG_03585 [Bizionia argentinensis JUB59]|uniref:Uncharacterized protein n=1 Tax=Bizionia argentinensis JUB59 TaxID=1046627 RepID=A0A4U8UHE0_9FLAO|nr:hypothetical protein BZARG_03585 [Bizionia argentinensis JUB59]